MSPAHDVAATPAPQVQALISYLEHEAQPMIVLDTQYRILAANTAYKRQFGAVDEPPVGHHCYAVSHHYDRPCDEAGEHCPMKRAFETRAPDRVLHVHHTPRGPEHVDVELRPILDARGHSGINVTVSIGLAMAISGDADISDVIERADRALYHAKSHGRNRVVSEGDPGQLSTAAE